MLVTLFAMVTAALFAGAALYVSLAEHPARMRLDDSGAVAQWKASYGRAAPMQAGLALLSLALGLWAWQQAPAAAKVAATFEPAAYTAH